MFNIYMYEYFEKNEDNTLQAHLLFNRSENIWLLIRNSYLYDK